MQLALKCHIVFLPFVRICYYNESFITTFVVTYKKCIRYVVVYCELYSREQSIVFQRAFLVDFHHFRHYTAGTWVFYHFFYTLRKISNYLDQEYVRVSEVTFCFVFALWIIRRYRRGCEKVSGQGYLLLHKLELFLNFWVKLDISFNVWKLMFNIE